MILDILSNAEHYCHLPDGIQTVLRAVKGYSASSYPAGTLALDGRDIYLVFSQYQTHPAADAISEAHRQYIDVMYMVEGSETVYVKPTAQLSRVTKAYDPEIEALLADTDADAVPIRLDAGSFLILFPEDAHAPGCYADGACPVKKIIGKVRIAPPQEESDT